jgi:hypothetical protein
MSGMDFPDLKTIIITACDDLYKSRKLITKKVIMGIVQAAGDWSEPELDLYVPRYINEWRLQNLAEDQSLLYADRINALEEQVNKYRASLLQAQHTINKLKADLISVSARARQQRADIIAELRGLLK